MCNLFKAVITGNKLPTCNGIVRIDKLDRQKLGAISLNGPPKL